MRKVESAGCLILLAILYWLVFYQNLPGTLDGMASKGPFPTADIVDRAMKIAMLAVSLYVIATRWAVTRQVWKYINPGVIAVLLVALTSFAWSADPSATLLRFISMISVVLVCFAISVAGWHPNRLQQMAIPAVMAILIVSLIAGIIYPDRIAEIGSDISQRGAWHGIANSKNQFGMMASMGVIICFNRVLARGWRAYWAIAGAATALLCLVLSRSDSSLLATMVAVATMVMLMRVPLIKRRFSALVVIAIACTLLMYEMIVQDMLPGTHMLLAPIAHLMGKDTTFSARTVIWKVVKEHIQGAPYLGTGYGAYWLGPTPNSPSYVFVPLMNFYPSEAHNGYLDIVNDMGILGLICLLAFIFFYIRQALRLLVHDRAQASLFLAVLFQEMVMNMSESDWFSRTSTFAILLLAATCMSRALLEYRTKPQLPMPAGERHVRRPSTARAWS